MSSEGLAGRKVNTMVRVVDILKIITYLSVLTGYAAIYRFTGLYYTFCFVVLILLAVYLDYRRIVHVPRWCVNAISLVVLVASVRRVDSDHLVEPILDALIILIALKLIEEKKFRDYMQIYAMSMFLLIGSTLMSFGVNFLFYFATLITLATMSLILLCYFTQDPEMAISRENMMKIGFQALLICAIALPSSSLFFLILPRTNFPFFNFFNKSGYGRSGFTDTVSLGEIADIQDDDAVIFRAEMGRIGDQDLFWRGIVLDEFDGASWRSSDEDQGILYRSLRGTGREEIQQTIYLEPYGNKYLFALDKPVSVVLYQARRVIHLERAPKDHIYERVRYTALSIPQDVLPEAQIDRARHLRLPPDYSPPIRELSEKVVAGLSSEEERVKALMKFTKFGEYQYSLKGLPVSKTPLEDFLFKSKRGNCEYFASSLAVMLRMAGIPARLVGGYRGGYYNRTANYYMVLQKNAHVWVEAFVEGKGWVRLLRP